MSRAAAYKQTPLDRKARKDIYVATPELFHNAWKLRKDSFVKSILKQGLRKGVITINQLAALEKTVNRLAKNSVKEAEEACRIAEAEHIGIVGQFIDITVKLVQKINGNGNYGPWTLKIMRTREGDTLTSFGNCELDLNDCAKIRCKIKAHDIHKKTGEKQTNITHIKVLKILAKGNLEIQQ